MKSGAYRSYDDKHSICLYGRCTGIGCDKQAGSDKRYNECGICGGSTSDCDAIQTVKKKNAKTSDREYLNCIFVINFVKACFVFFVSL